MAVNSTRPRCIDITKRKISCLISLKPSHKRMSVASRETKIGLNENSGLKRMKS